METIEPYNETPALPAHTCWPDDFQPGDLPSFYVKCPHCDHWHPHQRDDDDDDDGWRAAACGGPSYRIAFGCDVPLLTDSQVSLHNDRVDRAEAMLAAADDAERAAAAEVVGHRIARLLELIPTIPGLNDDQMMDALARAISHKIAAPTKNNKIDGGIHA